MAIIYSKERAFWPVFSISIFGLGKIEYDGDSIFVVGAYNSLVCVCRVCKDDSVWVISELVLFVLQRGEEHVL